MLRKKLPGVPLTSLPTQGDSPGDSRNIRNAKQKQPPKPKQAKAPKEKLKTWEEEKQHREQADLNSEIRQEIQERKARFQFSLNPDVAKQLASLIEYYKDVQDLSQEMTEIYKSIKATRDDHGWLDMTSYRNIKTGATTIYFEGIDEMLKNLKIDSHSNTATPKRRRSRLSPSHHRSPGQTRRPSNLRRNRQTKANFDFINQKIDTKGQPNLLEKNNSDTLEVPDDSGSDGKKFYGKNFQALAPVGLGILVGLGRGSQGQRGGVRVRGCRGVVGSPLRLSQI